jgi:RNA polymerase sigma-70 factor, ECF subfamily
MKLRNRRGSDEFLEATLPAIDLVYNLSRRFVADPLDAEDLVQETYARAFDAWQKGRRPRNVEAWIATICLNAGRSWVRRASRRREVPTEMDPSLPDPADVEEEALAGVRRKVVHEALWKLPEEQRIAIALMDLAGFTAREVARITRSPRGTVLARVHRGRKKLSEMLKEEALRLEP